MDTHIEKWTHSLRDRLTYIEIDRHIERWTHIEREKSNPLFLQAMVCTPFIVQLGSMELLRG